MSRPPPHRVAHPLTLRGTTASDAPHAAGGPPHAPARRDALATLAALAAATAAGTAQAQAQDATQRRAWPAGRPTPPVALPAWEGPAWRLEDQRGQVVVLNFWASWCEPCRAEMPSLELLAQRHERDRLQVLAVNFRETDAAIRRFLGTMPLTVPVLRDADGGVAKAWGVRIFPSTAVIGRDGRAAFIVTGEVDWTGAQARQWIASVL
jgi:thiol-disulfide isomerase/thioredoxin